MMIMILSICSVASANTVANELDSLTQEQSQALLKQNQLIIEEQQANFTERCEQLAEQLAPMAIRSTTAQSYYDFEGKQAGHSGSGAGSSDAYFPSNGNYSLDMNIRASAYAYGTYWGETKGWNYFDPSQSGTYCIYNTWQLSGLINNGSNINISLIVKDRTSGASSTINLRNLTDGTYNNSEDSETTQFYMTGGHKYIVYFDAKVTAGTSGYATSIDFENSTRHIERGYLGIYKY